MYTENISCVHVYVSACVHVYVSASACVSERGRMFFLFRYMCTTSSLSCGNIFRVRRNVFPHTAVCGNTFPQKRLDAVHIHNVCVSPLSIHTQLCVCVRVPHSVE